MSPWKSYRRLPSRTRVGVGLGVIAWGVIGLAVSDRAEEKFGFTPTEQDKAALDRVTPKIHAVDREARR